MPRGLYKIALDTLFFHLSQLAMATDIETIGWMRRVNLDRSRLDGLFQIVRADFLKRDPPGWTLADPAAERLEVFLSRIGELGDAVIGPKGPVSLPSIDGPDGPSQSP